MSEKIVLSCIFQIGPPGDEVKRQRNPFLPTGDSLAESSLLDKDLKIYMSEDTFGFRIVRISTGQIL